MFRLWYSRNACGTSLDLKLTRDLLLNFVHRYVRISLQHYVTLALYFTGPKLWNNIKEAFKIPPRFMLGSDIVSWVIFLPLRGLQRLIQCRLFRLYYPTASDQPHQPFL